MPSCYQLGPAVPPSGKFQRQRFDEKEESFFKSYTFLEECQASASYPIPSKTHKENSPVTLCQVRPVLGAPFSLLKKILSFREHQ